jgi:hypothetical protein
VLGTPIVFVTASPSVTLFILVVLPDKDDGTGSIADPDHDASEHQLVVLCRHNPPLSSGDLADIRKLLAADPRAANVTDQSKYVAH